MSDEPVTRQVQGVSEGVMERGDWAEFHINIGKQYPVKLATKKEEIKVMARMAGQQMAVWTFNETQGNPNPHRPGEFFKNRYLENVVVGGTLDPNLAQAPAGQQTLPNTQTSGGSQAPQMPDDRGRSIERQVIIKSAMYLYPTGIITTDEEWFALINKIDAFMVQVPDAPPVVADPTDAALPGTAAPVAAPEDDDIPF